MKPGNSVPTVRFEGLTPLQQIRLESVQLAYRHDRSPADILARATDLAKWIESGPAPGQPGNGGQAAQSGPT